MKYAAVAGILVILIGHWRKNLSAGSGVFRLKLRGVQRIYCCFRIEHLLTHLFSDEACIIDSNELRDTALNTMSTDLLHLRSVLICVLGL